MRDAGFEIGAHTVNHVNLGDAQRFERFGASPFPEHWNVDVSPETAEFEIADGTKRRLVPGDVLVAEDLTGHGHIARSIGDEFRVSLAVPLAD